MSDIDDVRDAIDDDLGDQRPAGLVSLAAESELHALFNSAAAMTPALEEQVWIVAMCRKARRTAVWLDAKLAEQKRRGRPVDRHPVGETWVDGPGPLGIDLRLVFS